MNRIIMNTFILSSILTSSCSYETNEDPHHKNDQSSSYSSPSRPVSNPTTTLPPPDKCADQDGKIDDSIVRYTVKRNSKLDERTYENGERLSGRFYIASYVVSEGECDDTDSTHGLYKEDIKGVWLEVSQMQPYNPNFIKTYFVPEEAMSFVDDSHELGLIINPDFLIIDQQYVAGNDYLIRIQVENKTGVVNSSGTWHNDIEAFNVMGFTVEGDVPEIVQDATEL